jgi:hypothetical protein
MKKILLLILLVGIVSCKNETERKYEQSIDALATDSSFIANTKAPIELSITERNEKLITACKSTPGTINADVYKDILTIQVTSVEPEEAQKIAEGIFNEVKKYKENEHIKTIMVCDINYKLLGYAGAKK